MSSLDSERRGLGPLCPLTATLSLHPQKKKGKEAASGASLPPPRVPALPPEARAPHTSSPAAAKRNKAKAKGKEVKKEVRFPMGPQAWVNCVAWLTDGGVPGCAPPPCPQIPRVAGGAASAHFILPLAWGVSPAGTPVPHVADSTEAWL